MRSTLTLAILLLVSLWGAACPLQFLSSEACTDASDCAVTEECVAERCAAVTDVDGGSGRTDGGPLPEPDADGGLDAGPQQDAGPVVLAARADTFSFDEDAAPAMLNILANDDFPSATTVSIETESPLPPGVFLDATGGLTFLLAENFNGQLTFSYRLVDLSTTEQSESVAVVIDVLPVNDAPQVSGVSPATVSLTGISQQVVTVTAFDVEGSPLTYSFSTDAPGVTITHSAPASNVATFASDAAASNGNFEARIVVSDPDGGRTEHVLPVQIASSMIVIDIQAGELSMYPGQSRSFDAGATTSSAADLVLGWQLLPELAGVTLSESDGATTEVSIDRETYYATNGFGAREVELTLTAQDATGNLQQQTLTLSILDERGPYVIGDSTFEYPCGARGRPCSRITEAITGQSSLVNDGVQTPPAIFVHEGIAVVETETIELDIEMDLFCGYVINGDGTWVAGTERTPIEVSSDVGIWQRDMVRKTVANCDVRLASDVTGNIQVGVSVATTANLENLSVVGGVNDDSNHSIGIRVEASDQPTIISNSQVLGAGGTPRLNAYGVRVFAPTQITNCDIEGGRSETRAVGLSIGNGADVTVVGGTIRGGNGDLRSHGVNGQGTGSATFDSVTIMGASSGETNESGALELSTSGTYVLNNSNVILAQALINDFERGVSFVPAGSGSLTLNNTNVTETPSPNVAGAQSVRAIRLDRGDSTAASFTMAGGTVRAGTAAAEATGLFAANCIDIAMTNVTIESDIAPLVVGIRSGGACDVTLSNVDLLLNEGNASNVEQRRGLVFDEGNAVVTGGTILLGRSGTELSGVLLSQAGSGSVAIRDMAISGSNSPSAVGVRATTALVNVELTNVEIEDFQTGNNGQVFGVKFDLGCSGCFLGRLLIDHANSATTGTISVGVGVHSAASSDSMVVYSSVIAPNRAAETAAIRTVGGSPDLGSSLSVAVLGSVLSTGFGPGATHAAVTMLHDTANDEPALDVIGVAIVADQNNSVGFVEECGSANNASGTRVGRAENIAFDTPASGFVFLQDADKVGVNCAVDDVVLINDFNATEFYEQDGPGDRSIAGDLGLADGIRPNGGSILIDAAPSLLEYYPANAPQPFLDFDASPRPLVDNDIGAIDP